MHMPPRGDVIYEFLRHKVGLWKPVNAEGHDIPFAGKVLHANKYRVIFLFGYFCGILCKSHLVMIGNTYAVETLAPCFRNKLKQVHSAVAGKCAFVKVSVYYQGVFLPYIKVLSWRAH